MSEDINMSTTNFSSLNVDVLLHLVRLIDPVDRLNLVLSGILKGFENANQGIDLRQRIEEIGIDLALRFDGMCQLEIRSLECRGLNDLKNDSLLIILERLVDGGYFQNNRQTIVKWDRPFIARLFRVICSMNNLEKLNLLKCVLTDTAMKDLALVFRSCPNLTELRLKLVESQKLEMGEELKNGLRSGFQRLRLFELHWGIHSWPVIQEMFTWLKECAQLTMQYCKFKWRTLVIDGSLTLNPDLAQNLQFLNLYEFPVEFVKWILPFCSNIHTLKLHLTQQSRDLHNEIVRLNKLKDLHIWIFGKGIDPKEIIRNCRQVEILRLNAFKFSLRYLADLEEKKNITEVHLHWVEGPSVKEVLPMLKRCTNLHLLTLTRVTNPCFPPLEELCDFIMELKQLTFLHLIYYHILDCEHFKPEVDEVKEFVLHHRPNFKFYFSCCSKFDESRVSIRGHSHIT